MFTICLKPPGDRMAGAIPLGERYRYLFRRILPRPHISHRRPHTVQNGPTKVGVCSLIWRTLSTPRVVLRFMSGAIGWITW